MAKLAFDLRDEAAAPRRTFGEVKERDGWC